MADDNRKPETEETEMLEKMLEIALMQNAPAGNRRKRSAQRNQHAQHFVLIRDPGRRDGGLLPFLSPDRVRAGS
ncbi:MAG: hypothetical protein ACR2ID_07185 [Chthoniobacterales bacterium]